MTATALDQRDPRVRRSAIGLLVVIAAGALALSFNGLALLGSLAGFGALAPVFAVVVDAGTAAATLYWLTGRPRSRSTRYARRFALALLAVSLAGNATAHALAAAGAAITGPAVALVLALPWWAAGTVGAIPPAVLAGVVHLLAMRDDPAPAGPVAPGGEAGDGGADLVARAAALVEAGRAAGEPVGRARLARELDVSEHRARGLLEQVAASNGAGPGEGR